LRRARERERRPERAVGRRPSIVGGGWPGVVWGRGAGPLPVRTSRAAGEAARDGATRGELAVGRWSGCFVAQCLEQRREARIESGAVGPHQRLPSIADLVQEYGIARTTAAKALKVLVDEGLAEVVPGWGTYVADR